MVISGQKYSDIYEVVFSCQRAYVCISSASGTQDDMLSLYLSPPVAAPYFITNLLFSTLRRLPLSMARMLAFCIRPAANQSMLSSYTPEISQELIPDKGRLASRTPYCEISQGTDEPAPLIMKTGDGGPIRSGRGSGRTVAFPVINQQS